VESAELAVTGHGVGELDPVAVSGNTVVSGASPLSGGSGKEALYVFRRPVRGWLGVVHQSAQLIPTRGLLSFGGDRIAIAGRNVFAGGTISSRVGAVFVFHRPKRGWSGTVHPRARLLAPSTTAVSAVTAFGSSVVAGGPASNGLPRVEVFKQPKRGWSGTMRPYARLRLSALPYGGETSPSLDSLAVSADTVAGLVLAPFSSSCYPTNVCEETLYTFSRPRHGWKGVIAADSRTTLPVGTVGFPLAIQGKTIATGGRGAVDIFTHS
jgi:hypothetical protein